ncbi:MAG: ATP-binding protein [Candidatus Thiodiazotropha sp.]
MKLQLERAYALAMIETFPDLSSLGQQLKISQRAEMPLTAFSPEQLGYLHELYRAGGAEMQGKAAQIATLRQAISHEGYRYGEGELERLVPDIAEFLIRDGIRGWLFKANPNAMPMPYLVMRIDFTPPGEEEAGRVLIDLKANTMARIDTLSLIIRERDLCQRTIAELFAEKGFLKETPGLIEAYDRSSEHYFAWRTEYGKQFSGKGTGYFAEDPSASHRNTDWSRKSRVVLSSSGGWARLVNDEDTIKERPLSVDVNGDILVKYLRKAGRSTRYSDQVEQAAEQLHEQIPDILFTELPVHGYILVYHLDLHHHLWVHADNLRPYDYQPDLKEKLVLPERHTDLIDILTAEMDLLMDDIVEGKSGGTTVLCSGPPGVGKTLTAEVYAEIIRRPLYRVHSGQLGLNVAEMEVALKQALTRAQRWGAVMLIDEADVYIKRRDDNIAANAVVGVFLRVLEYFNGLLFLTTNRVDDIDEAIVSRCIAMIRYQAPSLDERRRIWAVMSEQFGLALDDALLDWLARGFSQASGRDIKGLAKLVAKYCHHKSVQPERSVFQLCSVFRGLEPVTDV